MKDHVLDKMQSFSRAIIIPILFLPIVGILLALSSILSNPSIIGEGNLLSSLGQLLSGTLWPIMNNLSILFCIGIAMGLAKEKKAEAALISLFSYIAFLGANNAWLTLTQQIIPYETTFDLYGTGQTVQLGFQIIDMGVFLGMILGVVVSVIHNRYSNKELPGAFAIYGNTKLSFLILIPVVILLSIVLSYIWPIVAMGISALTNFMKTAGSLGVFLYGFLNRFLIPTGLHHLIWAPFLYSDIGGVLQLGGETFYGAAPIFLAQMANPAITQFHDSARFLQFGMVKMFGLLGIALAFYKTAKASNRKQLKAMLIPATLTSILVGITEPLEFTFLFVAPFLWVVHSLLSGVFEAVVTTLGVRTIANDGFINFFIQNLAAGADRTKWPLFLAVGLVQLVVYFFVFKFLIEKFNLKTPGREENGEISLKTRKDYQSKIKEKNNSKEMNPDLAKTIIEALGGPENIETIDNCYTRLRVTIIDGDRVNESVLKETGASGVIKKNKIIQIVYGLQVNKIRSLVEHTFRNMKELNK